MKIVEGTLIMPMTILLVASLIVLTIGFFTTFQAQVKGRVEMRKDIYKRSEVTFIRIKDKISDEIH